MGYYEMEIPKEKYTEVKNHLYNNSQSYVLFRSPRDSSLLFLLAHGSPEGKVSLCGVHYELKEILPMLLKHNLKEKGISKVLTISCFGGCQTPFFMDGVSISSVHEAKTEIETMVQMTLDDECILELRIP